MNNDNEQSFPNALAQGVESTPSSEEAFLDYLDMEVNLIWAGNPDKETLDNFRRSQDAAIGEQGQMPMNTAQEVEWLSNLHDRLLDHETTSQGVERLKLMLLERAIIAAILRRSPNDEKTVGHKASLLPRLTRHAKSLSKTGPDNYETHLSQFQKFYTKDARTYIDAHKGGPLAQPLISASPSTEPMHASSPNTQNPPISAPTELSPQYTALSNEQDSLLVREQSSQGENLKHFKPFLQLIIYEAMAMQNFRADIEPEAMRPSLNKLRQSRTGELRALTKNGENPETFFKSLQEQFEVLEHEATAPQMRLRFQFAQEAVLLIRLNRQRGQLSQPAVLQERKILRDRQIALINALPTEDHRRHFQVRIEKVQRFYDQETLAPVAVPLRENTAASPSIATSSQQQVAKASPRPESPPIGYCRGGGSSR